jgi:hypothetical protein
MITDDGLVELAAIFNEMKVVELDISHCTEITDIGIAALAEGSAYIKRLNMCGLHRVSYRSVQLVTTRCWELVELSLQDLFLLNDKAFIYEAACDGRAAANERMLVGLESLLFSD